MKKSILSSAIAATLICACGAPKQVASQTPTAQVGVNPFGETFSMPCEVYDTPEEFAATGVYRGSSYQKGELQLNALENAKQLVYAKYHHAYQGMVSNYSSTIGNNRGNDIATKLQRAGDQVIDAVLNDIQACCVKYGPVMDDGNCECYVAIKVPKSVLANQTAKVINDNLTQEEKDAINFEEFNYRKQMQERMQEYKEQQKK